MDTKKRNYCYLLPSYFKKYPASYYFLKDRKDLVFSMDGNSMARTDCFFHKSCKSKYPIKMNVINVIILFLFKNKTNVHETNNFNMLY